MFIMQGLDIPEDFQTELKRLDKEDLYTFLSNTTIRLKDGSKLYGDYWSSSYFDEWISNLTNKESVRFCHYVLYLLEELTADS
jgi:hypothetical protein